MDWATLGALLAGAGTLAGAVVAWLGKRGENHIAHQGVALTGFSSLTDNLQEELARKTADAAAAEAEVARLRRLVIDLGGDPS